MRTDHMKKFAYTAAAVFLLVSNAFALRPNDPAPLFSLRDSKGNDFSLSDYTGKNSKQKTKGVILSFFASWCIPCRNELPLINSVVEEFTSKGIPVVIIGHKEDFDTITSLLVELKVDKPIVLSDHHGKVAEKFGVRGLPVTFFIGADGNVKDILYGEVTDIKELRDRAGNLLKK